MAREFTRHRSQSAERSCPGSAVRPRPRSRRWPGAALLAWALFAGSWVAAQEPAGGPEEIRTLDQALRAATLASQSLERSRLAVDEARAELDAAQARRMPAVTASAGLAYIANPPDGITIPAGEFGSVQEPGSTLPVRVPDQPVVLVPDPENLGLSASVQLDQPLYTWGKLREGEAAARAGVEAGLAARARNERDLRRQVTLAYAGVLAGRASLPLVEEIVRILEQRRDDASRRVQAGAATRIDLLDAEAALAAARLELVRAGQGLRSAEAGLEWLAGVAVGELEPIAVPASVPPEEDLAARAAREHPRLAESRARSDQAGVQLSVARASRPLLPDLGLRVEAEVQGQRVPLVESNWIDSWDANLTVSIGATATVYDAGANAARIAGARAQLGQSLAAVAELESSLPLQVRAAYESLAVARAMRAGAEARVEQAREQARVAGVSFENEIITRAELLGSQAAVLEADLAGIAARLEEARAFAELEYLAGPLR